MNLSGRDEQKLVHLAFGLLDFVVVLKRVERALEKAANLIIQIHARSVFVVLQKDRDALLFFVRQICAFFLAQSRRVFRLARQIGAPHGRVCRAAA